MEEKISGLIEDLVLYAQNKLGLCREDAVYARNQLLELFLVSPATRKGELKDFQSEILDPLTKLGAEIGLYGENGELHFETKIMGLVTPSCGLVVAEFCRLNKISAKDATDYLYNLSINSNYIRLKDVKKNISWQADGPLGSLGITINLSKPEKDNKQVLAERNFKGVKYPKCLLCLENLGFSGNISHPARQTLRVAPLLLNNEDWHLQYSPYVYYDEHCIAFSDEHRPMKISPQTFVRLLDFAEQFPYYFMGSNADLPIVGGSILSHDHYQGGKKALPMFARPMRRVFYTEKGLTAGIRDWYNSVVTVKGTDREKVLQTAVRVLNAWKVYTDESVGIIAHTGDTPHNTVTPIGSMENGEYVLDLILRNNRTDSAHPYGIYHPTEDMHNIKKEGIGLIEAMGLFILPGRLKSEIAEMIDILAGGKLDFAVFKENAAIGKHIALLAEIAAEYDGKTPKRKEASRAILSKIENICVRILECTAVFKNNEDGAEAFAVFLDSALS